jgi:adhesin transport system outer membrane protein
MGVAVAMLCMCGMAAAQVDDAGAAGDARVQAQTYQYLADELELTRTPGVGDGAEFESLEALLAEVWRSNPRVHRALADIEAAGYDLAAARTGFYPYLSVSASEGTDDTGSTSVSLVQPLWRGGRTLAEMDQAGAQRDVALADLNLARLELGMETSEAYLNVVLAQEQLLRWRQYIGGLEYLQGVIRNRVDNGVSPPVDLETVVTRIRQAEAGAENTAASLESNRSRLMSLLDREAGTVAWPGEETQLSPGEVAALLVNGVVPLHPEQQNALSQIEVQEARQRVSKSQLWPQLSVQHSRALERAINDTVTPDSSTQLVLEYSTESGLRGLRGAQAEGQRVEAARRALSTVQRDIANRIRSARAERDASAAAFRAQAAAAASAVELVQSFLRQFKVGRKAWLEVLNAQREAHDALLQVAAVKRNYWLANLRLALQGMHWGAVSAGAPPIYVESDKYVESDRYQP